MYVITAFISASCVGGSCIMNCSSLFSYWTPCLKSCQINCK